VLSDQCEQCYQTSVNSAIRPVWTVLSDQCCPWH